MEKGSDTKDYKKELLTMFANMDVFFDTPHKRHIAERYRNFFMRVSTIATAEDFKHIYEGTHLGRSEDENLPGALSQNLW